MSSSAARKSANPDLAVILLAAGTSSRLGQPKQLLRYKGTTLVRERVAMIRQAFPRLKQLIVVTGAKRVAILEALSGLAFKEAYNANFEFGMSGSLRAGLAALSPETQAAFFLLADQPLISHVRLQEMVRIWEKHPEKVIAAAYAEIEGVPAIFPKQYFEKLMAVEGDKGARKVLSQIGEGEKMQFHLPEAAVDIDVENDLGHLL